MSEPENATKAPESDANEPSTTESSAPAEHVVGEHCVTDRPTRTFLALKSQLHY